MTRTSSTFVLMLGLWWLWHTPLLEVISLRNPWERHEMKLVCSTIQGIIVERPEPTEEHPQGMCLDKGYDYDAVYAILQEFGFTAHVRPRGEEAKAIKREAGFKARRWVVERAHSWLNRFRRLLVRSREKAAELSGIAPFCLRLDCFSGCWVIRIGFLEVRERRPFSFAGVSTNRELEAAVTDVECCRALAGSQSLAHG